MEARGIYAAKQTQDAGKFAKGLMAEPRRDRQGPRRHGRPWFRSTEGKLFKPRRPRQGVPHIPHGNGPSQHRGRPGSRQTLKATTTQPREPQGLSGRDRCHRKDRHAPNYKLSMRRSSAFRNSVFWLVLAITGIGISAGVGMGFYIGTSHLSRPIKRVTTAINEVAERQFRRGSTFCRSQGRNRRDGRGRRHLQAKTASPSSV